MLKPDEIWRIFEVSGALLSGHFKLTSGKHSNRYIQCAQVLQYPRKTEKLCAELIRRLDPGAIDVVVGPATGGIILAYELAAQLQARAMFTEREKGHMALRRGFALEKGQKVLVVEDVVTTGGSLQETATAVRDSGAEVLACASLVDRSGGSVNFDLPFVALLTLEVKAYDPDNCPLCREGKPAVKPGSRQEI